MEPHDRQMLTEIHGLVHGIKPILDLHTVAIAKIDDRARAADVKIGEQDVKIERVKLDLDGLGRKIRVVADARRAPAAESGGGKWLTALALLAELPKYAHAAIVIGGLALTAAVVLIRHWPGR